jgi:hypothetical protein
MSDFYRIKSVPATEDQLYEALSSGKHIQGNVEISPDELINNNEEGVLDLLSTRLIGSELLSDISYEVIRWNPDTQCLIVKVAGDASEAYQLVDTVTCGICHREAPAASARLHQNDQICVLCWDDRLKSSE